MKILSLKEMEVIEAGKNGQDTLNCVTDAYSNHGWASIGLGLMSALVPAGVFITTYACAVRNL